MESHRSEPKFSNRNNRIISTRARITNGSTTEFRVDDDGNFHETRVARWPDLLENPGAYPVVEVFLG